MRLLYLPHYFFPEQIAASRINMEKLEAFATSGDEVIMYVPNPCRGISQEVKKEYSLKQHRSEYMFDGRVEVHRFPMFSEGKNVFLRAFRYFLCWFIQMSKGLFCKRLDCVLVDSTPPIQGLIGVIIKKLRGIQYVYNLQDIFPDSLVGAGLTKKDNILWKIGRYIENTTYRNASKIIVLSEDFKKNIMNKGVPEEKIEVIYNWIDTKAVSPIEKEDNILIDELGLSNSTFTVVYAGNLGNAQNIVIVLDAAAKLPHYQFVIFGSGGMEGDIKRRIDNDKLDNVFLFPLQPFERVSYVYSLGDACVVSCKSGFGGSAMPSKTWTIMSCGRPVIANFDEGELKETIENNHCGLFTHSGNVYEFVEAIRYLAVNPLKCREMGENARSYVLNNLTKEVGTQKFLSVLHSVCN